MDAEIVRRGVNELFDSHILKGVGIHRGVTGIICESIGIKEFRPNEEYFVELTFHPKETGPERCEHKRYSPAGYYNCIYRSKALLIKSMYDVFCHDCGHYINLLDGKILDDNKALQHLDQNGKIVR